MDLSQLSIAEHIEAIERTVYAGFRFRCYTDPEGVVALEGYLAANGALDLYLVLGPDEASAARFRVDDLAGPDPPALWQRQGSVADVIAELLGLPPHGRPGAPSLAVRRADLWLPGMPWR